MSVPNDFDWIEKVKLAAWPYVVRQKAGQRAQDKRGIGTSQKNCHLRHSTPSLLYFTFFLILSFSLAFSSFQSPPISSAQTPWLLHIIFCAILSALSLSPSCSLLPPHPPLVLTILCFHSPGSLLIILHKSFISFPQGASLKEREGVNKGDNER